MSRLVVASNRTATPGAPRAGGLAVALADALDERGGGLWYGWSGAIGDGDPGEPRRTTEGEIEFALTDLTQAEHDGFYLGYANRTLWPIFHYRVDLAKFDEGTFEIYEAVNRRYGAELAALAKPGDIVWIHDYQLMLMGLALRETGWEGPMGFFLHIPFPAPEVFMALPEHHDIARGLTSFDLVGFQTSRDTANFARYLKEQCEAEEIGDGRFRVFGRELRAAAFPIGIDPEEFARFAEGEAAEGAMERVVRHKGRALVLGVDRMDYSKGIPHRLEAFGMLLDEHEELRSRVWLLQISPPSREAVDAYQELRESVDRLSGRINGDLGDLDWSPVRYLARSYPRDVLAGLYRAARVGLITPLYDGMNLVAKEFVAAQDPEDPGVLVLSEFAGSAEQMQSALLVNPHDIGALAQTIMRALTMPIEERQERWRALIAGVRTEDIAWWRRRYLEALEATGPAA